MRPPLIWLVAVLLIALNTACVSSGEARVLKSEPIGPGKPPSAAVTQGENRRGGQVWVALEVARSIIRVDLRKRRVARRLKVSGRPHNIAVSGMGLVAATLWGNERVALVQREWRKGVELSGAPHDVKIGGGRIVVANQGAARIDILSLRGKKRGSIPLRENPHDVALTPGGDVAWASLEGSDDLAVVNLKRKKVKRYVSTGRSPHDLLFSPNGRLWVTDWNGAFHVYSRRGKHLKSRALGDEAHHLAFTPSGRQVWITDHGTHQIFVVSARKYKVMKRLSIRGSPHHVAITSDGKKAVVADHDRGLLIVYRVDTRKRIGKIKVGAGPHGVWAPP